MGALYLDDLRIGQCFVSGACTVSAEAITRFAAQYDPQPFHLDDVAAHATMFGGLVASGWHTACLTMRLLVDGGLPIARGIISSGGELHWPSPVRPGDTLHVECQVLEITPSRSRSDRGTVGVRCLTKNQKGETVQSFTPKLIVPRRGA
jgi:acyl dehydratase